ncbi:N-acetylmuramoyl-L-alanine amidase family protein [Mariniphaga sediminis]|jgi:N-acetylmuramoyl-L-alanine amidase|uniref:N-acetylmuramoyl-L-alanine amidase family protein n=1 Tax=Mariniphaga sediminis TaxID=1628158 RepID=UPI001559BDA6|nr:N-acetylmuramoyl-L-alanine amidase [Mariniphaga sediminis]
MKVVPYICAFLFINCGLPGVVRAGPPVDESHVRTVVIDPGHGGRDPGAVHGRAREKDIVLDISLRLGKYIQQNFPEVKVIYTRDRDVFVPLYRRAAIANENDADLFISIHVNAVQRGLVQGTETYILGQHRTKDNLEVAKKENAVILLEDDYRTTYEGFDPNSSESYIMFELVQDEYLEQSAMLASAIQDQFRERAKRIDRSVKQAGFLVLRQTTMPSILVETGFLSHPSERNFLMSEPGRDYLASAIYRAFRDYKKKVEAKSSFNLVTVPSAPLSPGNVNGSESRENQVAQKPDIIFSVQVASLASPVEIKPSNFNGESEIFMQNSGKTYRYFCGKYSTIEQAKAERKRLRSRFNGAFVVAFENGELIPVDVALQKM